MKSVIDWVKNNKIKVLVVFLIIVIIIGIYKFIELKKKTYNLTEVSTHNYFILNIDSKYGVIDVLGKTIVEPIYDSVKIPNPEKAVFICEKQDKTIVLNENNEEIFTKYEEVTAISLDGIVSNIPYEKTVLKYKKDGKYGLISFEGKEITKPIYDEIKGLENKESELLVKIDGKYGVINSKGAKLIKTEYDNIVADGFYTQTDKYRLSGYIVSNKTTKGYRYGYINHKQKMILEVEYNEIYRILETEETKDVYIIACKNGQYGVVKNNKVLIGYSYQGIEYDNNNKIFELQKEAKFGIADSNGKEIIPVEYAEIEIKGMYIKALKNEDEGYIYFNTLGEKVNDVKYTSILKTSNYNYYITTNEEGFYGIIDNNNNELVENKYSYIEYLFGEYFIAAKENGYLGVINIEDDVIIDFKYEVLQKIADTNVIEAKILKQNKLELYSVNLENIYSKTGALANKEEEYIKVYSDLEVKYFDFNGNEKETKDVYKNNTLLADQKDDKWGFVDRSGKLVVDYKYDKVTEFNEYGFAGIKMDNKWGVIDANGNIVAEPIYEITQTNIEPEFLGKYYKVYYGYGEFYYTDKT